MIGKTMAAKSNEKLARFEIQTLKIAAQDVDVSYLIPCRSGS